MSDSNRRPTAYKAVALPLSQSGVFLFISWCEWPESNRHAITAADFKSAVATDYTTLAFLTCIYYTINQVNCFLATDQLFSTLATEFITLAIRPMSRSCSTE